MSAVIKDNAHGKTLVSLRGLNKHYGDFTAVDNLDLEIQDGEFLTFLGSYFATVLNTLLGVESIDESYFRAARSLGARPRDVFFKVILPGAMPFIFTGLQISMGYAWFSLVAGEMLAGEYGLGYLIWNSFMLVQYPVIIIAMITLGVIGSLSSLLIRMIGNRLMQWKVREEVR